MPNYICTTCGVQHAEAVLPPEHCAICEDERQYIGWDGQRWTTLTDLQRSYRNQLDVEGPELISIASDPKFAIGQRMLHLRAGTANLLWDCISLVDDRSVAAIQALGGVSAIAISHPHFYGSMVEWSRALGNVPVYLHESDRQWVMRPDPTLVSWSGDTCAVAPGVTLVRCGGHFPGATVLHWAGGAGGKGALLVSDVIQVGEDRKSVSFMFSYPNYIPVNAGAVRRIVAAVEPFPFDAMYGGWFGRNVSTGARDALARSAERYLRAIGPE